MGAPVEDATTLVTVIDMTCVRAVDANSGDRLTINGDSTSVKLYSTENAESPTATVNWLGAGEGSKRRSRAIVEDVSEAVGVTLGTGDVLAVTVDDAELVAVLESVPVALPVSETETLGVAVSVG